LAVFGAIATEVEVPAGVVGLAGEDGLLFGVVVPLHAQHNKVTKIGSNFVVGRMA
jgi:hypothetical protein